jgi:protein SCO1/2
MKKHSYIGISFIILLFGIYTVPKVVNHFSVEALHKFSQVPAFEFINQRGDSVTDQTYKGKVYVAEFFFTTCPTICPIMNEKMGSIQNEFFGNPNFGIASISINPDHDTSEILKAYADEFKVTSPNWHLLSGKPKEDVFALAKTGFKLYAGLAKEEVGGFEHSGLFALIDKNGFIRSRTDKNGNPIMYYRAIKENEFGDQIKELKEDIAILLKE